MLFARTDVTDTEQVTAAVDAAVEMAPLKSLVNCAGIGWATRTIGRDGDTRRRTTSTSTVG